MVCNLPRYADLPASQIVPLLADKGVYIGSESTIYRVLKKHRQLTHRGKAKPRNKHPLPTSYGKRAESGIHLGHQLLSLKRQRFLVPV